MMNNNKELQHNVELNKSKFLLIGFVIGIIPFIVLILSISIVKGGIEFIPSLFKNTIIIFGLITSLSNAFIFKHMALNKLKEFSK